MSQYERIEEDSTRPGFVRFTSLDSRFPIAISVPISLHSGLFYDMNDESNLVLSSGTSLVIKREDMRLLAERNIWRAQEVTKGSKDMAWYARETFDQWKRSGYSSVSRYQLLERDRDMTVVGNGSSAFRAPTIIWKTSSGAEGLQIFFTRRPSDVVSSRPSSFLLWTIILHPDRELRPQWQAILSSFQWLD
ncbi:MAG: hypothetical protein OJF49_003376 [Ktedonobacterales bacterium]|jgi:hypothetical protein|nr:MAG: hypothetical protein OJF49_003376 [Ktedonobacterales bacterium]